MEKKEKMLITRIVFFFPQWFLSLKNKFHHFNTQLVFHGLQTLSIWASPKFVVCRVKKFYQINNAGFIIFFLNADKVHTRIQVYIITFIAIESGSSFLKYLTIAVETFFKHSKKSLLKFTSTSYVIKRVFFPTFVIKALQLKCGYIILVLKY